MKSEMTSHIIWSALFIILQFSLAFSRNVPSPDDIQLNKDNETAVASSNSSLRSWDGIRVDLSSEEIVVNPNGINFKDYDEDQSVSSHDGTNMGLWIGISIGSIVFVLLIFLGIAIGCCCKKRQVIHGTVVRANRANEVWNAQAMIQQRQLPTTNEKTQGLPPPYEPPMQHAQYPTSHPGFQYSPAQQQYQQSPNALQPNAVNLPLQNQLEFENPLTQCTCSSRTQ